MNPEHRNYNEQTQTQLHLQVTEVIITLIK